MEEVSGEKMQGLLLTLLQCRTPDEASVILGKEIEYARYLFETVDWRKLREDLGCRELRFPPINWGIRSLDFSNCDFGDGDISFNGMGAASVSFNHAHFGSGDVGFMACGFLSFFFSDVTFSGGGTIHFNGTEFCEMASLSISDLGSKSLDFGPMYKGDGPLPSKVPCILGGEKFEIRIKESLGTCIDFEEAEFHAKKVDMDFSGANNLWRANFNSTHWHSQSVIIYHLRLGYPSDVLSDNGLIFTFANFSKVRSLRFAGLGTSRGVLNFSFVDFPEKGVTQFDFEDLGPGIVIFRQAIIPGDVIFRQREGAKFLCDVSFTGSTFDGPLIIDGMKFGPVPDLIGTEFRKHLNLSNVEFGASMNWREKRDEYQRGAKLQRIKELAEANKDHSLALHCHAEEMRFNRFRKKGVGQFCADVLDVFYECTSNYGQSIALPMLWIAFFWANFGILYRYLFEAVESPLLFSFAWTFPFLPTAGILRLTAYRDVFAAADPGLYALMGLQGLISIALIFLVGLGFRNRFRI